MKSTFFRQHMVNDINDDDDMVMMIMKLIQGAVRNRTCVLIILLYLVTTKKSVDLLIYSLLYVWMTTKKIQSPSDASCGGVMTLNKKVRSFFTRAHARRGELLSLAVIA